MPKGHIKRIVANKGFGFIQASGEEYFFHKSALNMDWNELVDDYESRDTNDRIKVSFVVGNSAKGPRAEDVRVIE